MGAISSKVGENGIAQSRKSLKPRSSLNLLRRRTPSNPTRASCPLPVAVAAVDEVDDIDNITEPEEQQRRRPPPPAIYQESRRSPTDSSVVSSTSEETERVSDSLTGATTPATVTRVPTPENIDRDGRVSTPESEGSRSSTPALSLTPKISLPQPSMLPEDSPTKYGLRSTIETPSPDKRLTREQRKKITGPGLFAHGARQLKLHHNAPDPVLSHSGSFSQSTPCLLSSKGDQDLHNDSQPSWLSRPVTGHSFHGILLGRANRYYNVVHALPMQPCQLDCFRKHDGWHPAAKPRHNSLHPVSCAVCDEYGAPVEGQETAGDDFMRCNWCWLIVCGKCHGAFIGGGVADMMGRRPGGIKGGEGPTATAAATAVLAM